MQHYFHPASRAVTTHWMLTELGVEHDQVVVDIQAGETNTEAFRDINPMQKIPVLVDGDIIVSEVAAICAYLADKYSEQGLAPAVNSPLRGRYYRYLFFTTSTLEPMLTTKLIGFTDYSAASVGWGDSERCMATVESLAPANDWALGERFSAADVVFGGTLDFAVQLGWIESPSERVVDYVRRLKSREAYRVSHDSTWW